MEVNMRGKKLGSWLIIGTALFLTVPQLSAEERNWMRDYVRLRIMEKNLKSIAGSNSTVDRATLQKSLTPRIVGGGIAGAGDNPFQVALLNRNIQNTQQAQFCGGTLIRENFVVTAAHCSDFVMAAGVEVLTGTRRLDNTGVRRQVTRITIHPGWNDDTMDNDVAVWEMATNATGMPVASLATDDGNVGNNLLATGWGSLTQGGGGPIDLHSVQVPLVERANCNDANSYNGAITDNMICAGRDIGGIDTCQGDSGGPLTSGTNNSLLTGITSWGFGCAQPNLFGVYTRVSQAGIRRFITNAVMRVEAVLHDMTIGAGGWQTDRHVRTAADVNGDGRADLIGFGEHDVFVAYAQPNGTFSAVQAVLHDMTIGAGGWQTDRHVRTAADVNGDGRADLIGFGEHDVFASH
jgi:trypsin